MTCGTSTQIARIQGKRKRPFASGRLPLAVGPPLAFGLLCAAVLLPLNFLPFAFVVSLAAYALMSFSYAVWLKRKIIIDVVLLSILYGVRLIAGGAATGIPISEWLLAFSFFLFTSLAFAKRHSELLRLASTMDGGSAKGRGYRAVDIRLLETMGTGCGILGVLVLALYINSAQVKNTLFVSGHSLGLVSVALVLDWATLACQRSR